MEGSVHPSALCFERRVGAASAALAPAYRPRNPQTTLLHRITHQHLESMLAEARAQTEHGFGYPRFIERNFRNFLACGRLERGFARVRCAACGFERLLAFSCKSRLCPSCHARRMHDTAFRLEEYLLPKVPYRQWVMTFPREIRYLMAQDRTLIASILAIVIRALFAYQRLLARRDGYPDVLPGGITMIQTFGSALNLNIHKHILLMDGVFIDTPVEEPITFLELPPPTPTEIEQLLAKIKRRVLRKVAELYQARGDGDSDTEALAQSQAHAVSLCLPHIATHNDSNADHHSAGHRAAQLCASGDGFSLHAGVALGANDRKGLLRLLRYGARQSFAQDRLKELPDGNIEYELHRPWGNRRTITLSPTALLHRLAALLPAPYLHLTRYHGCFAPNARRRSELLNIAFKNPKHSGEKFAVENHDDGSAAPIAPLPEPVPRAIPWAELLKRTFEVDVLHCPKCDGRMSVIAFITDLCLVTKILAHLRLPTRLDPPAPAKFPEQITFDFTDTDDTHSDEPVFDINDDRPSCRGPP